MQTATEQLQSIADAWAQRLGGKISVEINVVTYAGNQRYKSPPSFGAYIGDIGSDFAWKGFAESAEKAIAESERKWRLDGAPTDPKDAERCKLKARAAELGLRIVEDEPNIDPVRDL